ncbi:MAG: tripartite tricarboxylate transporter TctB family protein [Rhodospirillaceae bacterium]|nr:tripartite tricarboxylate transporter TctB family protein [Rhodospirillaceae bacterium]
MAEPGQDLLPHEERLPPRVDLWTAAVFFVAGIAIVYGAWLMPTYRAQSDQPYTAPGIVPALYGIVIAFLAIWLALRSIGRGALRPQPRKPRVKREGYSNARLALAAVLCLAFAAGMVGHLPFWMAAAIFVFLFILLFEWRPGLPARERIRPIATALIVAIGTGFFVVLVFQRVFLVRLP